MNLLGLAVRRAAAQRSLAAAMVCGLSFSVGVLIAGPVFAAGAERAIVSAYVRRSSPLTTVTTVSVLASSGFHPRLAADRLRSLLAPLGITRVTEQESSGSMHVSAGNGSALAALAFRDGVFAEAPLVRGRDPSGPGEVLLPQSVADSIGASPGARVRLSYSSSTWATVAGTYSATPLGDPLVFGRGRLLYPGAGNSLPILATSAGFSALTQRAGQRSGIAYEWDGEPDASGLSIGGLRALVRREPRVASRITAAISGSSVSSDLGSLIPGAVRAVAQGLAPCYVVVVAVALVGLAVVLGVGELRLDRQSFEVAVLKTRGARTRKLLAMQAAEAALMVVPAFPLSLAVGLGLSRLARAARGPALPGAPLPISLTPGAVAAGLAGVAVAFAALLLLSLPRLRRTVAQERRMLSRERSPWWLRLPYEAVPLLAGVIALSELRRHGTRSGMGGLDPLALAAPALVLLGGGMLAVRLMLWAAQRADRSADRIGSPPVYLALHRLARSNANAALAMLVILSAGLMAFASSLRATELSGNQDIARRQIGADWSLYVSPPSQSIIGANRLGGSATLVFYGSASDSSNSRLALADVVGVDPATYPANGWWQPQDAERPLASLLPKLRTPALGMRVPADASELRLRATAPRLGGLRLWAVLQSPRGAVTDRRLGVVRGGTWTYRTTVAGSGRLLSLVVGGSAKAEASHLGTTGFDVTFDSATLAGRGGSRVIDLSAWHGLYTGGALVRTAPAGGGLRAEFAVIKGGPVGGIAPPSPALPALAGGAVGGRPPAGAVLDVGPARLPVRVAGSVRTFPALADAGVPIVLVSVRALLERFQQVMQPPSGGVFAALAMGATSPAGSARAAGFQVTDVLGASAIEAQLASRQEDLAIGLDFAASVAGGLLAALALALTVYFRSRRQEYEFASLGALGGRVRDGVMALALEYGLVLLACLAFGSLAGLGLLRLSLPSLAPSATTATAGLLVDWPLIAASAGAAVATLGGALAIASVRLRQLSAVAVLRGEPT